MRVRIQSSSIIGRLTPPSSKNHDAESFAHVLSHANTKIIGKGSLLKRPVHNISEGLEALEVESHNSISTVSLFEVRQLDWFREMR